MSRLKWLYSASYKENQAPQPRVTWTHEIWYIYYVKIHQKVSWTRTLITTGNRAAIFIYSCHFDHDFPSIQQIQQPL